MRYGIYRWLVAGALVAGCQELPRPTDPGPTPTRETVGHVRLPLNWASKSLAPARYVPEAAVRAEVTIFGPTGKLVASWTLQRPGAPEDPLAMEVPPGSGYTAIIRFVDAAGTLVAKGSSLPFDVPRQEAVSVEFAFAPIITTFAGSGEAGYWGDGGLATAARLNNPLGMAIDPEGRLYLAEYANHVIRRVETDGTIQTVVGAGVQALRVPTVGDSTKVDEARLWNPRALAFAPHGDLFVTDYNSRRLRVLAATGGDRYGNFLSAGHLHTLYATSLLSLHGLAIDEVGNVFLGDRSTLKVLPPEGKMAEVAGTGVLGRDDDGPALNSALTLPDGVAVDPVGNVLFAERSNHRIRLLCRQPGTYFGMAMASGSVYTIAGVGQATSPPTHPLGDGGDARLASFNTPQGIALDARGNLYIADTSNHRIRMLSPDRIISTFAGTGDRTPEGTLEVGDGGWASEATFANPTGLLIRHGSLFISDANNHRVRRIRL